MAPAAAVFICLLILCLTHSAFAPHSNPPRAHKWYQQPRRTAGTTRRHRPLGPKPAKLQAAGLRGLSRTTMDVIAPQNVKADAGRCQRTLPPARRRPPRAAKHLAPPAPQPPSTVVKPPLAPHNVVVDAVTKPQNDGATPARRAAAPWVDTSNKMQRRRQRARRQRKKDARASGRRRGSRTGRRADAAWTRVPGLATRSGRG